MLCSIVWICGHVNMQTWNTGIWLPDPPGAWLWRQSYLEPSGVVTGAVYNGTHGWKAGCGDRTASRCLNKALHFHMVIGILRIPRSRSAAAYFMLCNPRQVCRNTRDPPVSGLMARIGESRLSHMVLPSPNTSSKHICRVPHVHSHSSPRLRSDRYMRNVLSSDIVY